MNTAPAPALAPSPAADDDAPANDAPANSLPRLVRPRGLYALAGEAGPRRPRIRRAEGDHAAMVSDADLELLAAAELAFRRQWAGDLGLNAATVDLYALPPVEPAGDSDDHGA